MRYRLIARGAKVDLKSSSSVRAHFDGLYFDEVSEDPTLLLFFFFFCMFPRVLLTLCVATGHIESFGRCNFCYGSCLGNGYPHYF